MFIGNVCNIQGGIAKNKDVRKYLQEISRWTVENPSTLYLTVAKQSAVFANRKIVVRLEKDENDGENENSFSTSSYSFDKLCETENPLTKQLGHLTIRDLVKRVEEPPIMDAALSSKQNMYSTTNMLYSGGFVVEYDLVKNDQSGKRYLFSEADFLEKNISPYQMMISSSTNNNNNKKVNTKKFQKLNNIFSDEGVIVSIACLFKDIATVIKLYKEECHLIEASCIEPAFRKMMAVKYGKGVTKRMFDVAFLASVNLMGVKIVFFPTAIEPSSSYFHDNCTDDDEEKNVPTATDIKKLLAMQIDLLCRCMPKIVENVEQQLLKENRFF